MRVSADAHSPDYRPDLLGRVNILLDNEEVDLVLMADEEAGILVRFVPDENGRPQIDPNNTEQALMETLHGEVRIMIGDDE